MDTLLAFPDTVTLVDFMLDVQPSCTEVDTKHCIVKGKLSEQVIQKAVCCYHAVVVHPRQLPSIDWDTYSQN